MSKIQLNATSGGGSVSIQGPSSSGSDSVFTINGTANGLIHTTTLGPAFFARNNNTQSLSNGTSTKIAFDNEIFDTDNCYDHSTNYRFTPNLAGYYLIRGNVSIQSMTGTMGANIFKNGSRFVNMDRNMDGSGGQSINITSLVPMNGSSDFVEIFVFQNSGGTRSMVNGSQFAVTEFSGMFVRSLA